MKKIKYSLLVLLLIALVGCAQTIPNNPGGDNNTGNNNNDGNDNTGDNNNGGNDNTGDNNNGGEEKQMRNILD